MSALHKIDRAKKHFQELEEQINSFWKRKPFSVVEKIELDGKKSFKLKISENIPSEIWACIVGDIIHNLRSALDLKVAELVIENGSTIATGPNGNCFPVSDDQQKFVSSYTRKLKGVSNEKIQKIVSLKPYKSKNFLLWELNDLDISDKHHSLIIAGSSYESFSLDMWNHLANLNSPLSEGLKKMIKNGSVPRIGIKPLDKMFPLQDESVLLIISPQVNQSIEFDPPNFQFEISFSKTETGNSEALLPKLKQLIQVVEQTINFLS